MRLSYGQDVQEVLEKLEVSKQAARLGKKVESMIVQLNDALKGLENEYMNIRGGDSVTSEIENRYIKYLERCMKLIYQLIVTTSHVCIYTGTN